MKLPHVVTNAVSARTNPGGNPSGEHFGSTSSVANFAVATWTIGLRAECALQERFKDAESERTKNKEERCVVGTMSKFARGTPAMKSLGIADHL